MNLAVAPDQYYLGVTEDGQLEVIETCGNTLVQSRFFITYGDMDALNSIRDQEYKYQSAGVARTSAGRVEGGVRHQFTRTENGFAAFAYKMIAKKRALSIHRFSNRAAALFCRLAPRRFVREVFAAACNVQK